MAELRRIVPPNLRAPDAARSWRALGRVLAMAATCLWLLGRIDIGDGIALWELPALIALQVAYGWVLVGLFALGHDSGHGAFSNTKWVNTLVGHLCMSPLGNSLVAWQATHDRHHRHTQLRGQDVDWSANLRTRAEFHSSRGGPSPLVRLGYRLPFGIFIWIGWNTLCRAMRLRSMLPSAQRQGLKKALRRSNLAMYGSLLLIYGGLWSTLGFEAMLRYHGIPSAIAMLTGSFIITIQHAHSRSLIYAPGGWDPSRSPMASTFDVRFPKWIEYLWCNINVHIPHHVAPGIPWYHLDESARLLSEALPGRYLESRFGLEHLRLFWRTPFLQPVEGQGYFILDSSEDA